MPSAQDVNSGLETVQERYRSLDNLRLSQTDRLNNKVKNLHANSKLRKLRSKRGRNSQPNLIPEREVDNQDPYQLNSNGQVASGAPFALQPTRRGTQQKMQISQKPIRQGFMSSTAIQYPSITLPSITDLSPYAENEAANSQADQADHTADFSRTGSIKQGPGQTTQGKSLCSWNATGSNQMKISIYNYQTKATGLLGNQIFYPDSLIINPYSAYTKIQM